MRRNELGSPAGWYLVLSMIGLGEAAVAADPPPDDRMAAIVAAVRAEEAKFRDIEYVAKVVVRDPERQGSGRPRRGHDAGDAPRRPPGRAELLLSPVLRAPVRVQGATGGDLGLRRGTDAHGRRRQLREHPPGPFPAPRHLPRACIDAVPRPGQFPAVGLPGRDRGDPCASPVPARAGRIRPVGCLHQGRHPVRGRGDTRRAPLLQGPRGPLVQPARRSDLATPLAGPRAELPLRPGASPGA